MHKWLPNVRKVGLKKTSKNSMYIQILIWRKKQKKEKIKSEKHDLDDEEISELELREANK